MTQAAVVLAAGAGRRLGGVAKATLRTNAGQSFLAAIKDCLVQAGVTEVCVVVGEPHLNEVIAEAEVLQLAWRQNPNPERGMAASVEVGFRELATRIPAGVGLLWPVDHYGVRADTVRQLLKRSHTRNIVIPTFGGRGGHPTAFGSWCWTDLTRCDGNNGARGVLAAYADNVVRFEVDDPGVVVDVDSRAEL